MAAYHKVEVSLNTNAVEVGIPSPQSVTVTVPTVGPVGPQGPAGPKGDPGEVSGSIAWDNVTDKPSTFTPSSHTHVAADITDFTSAVEAVSPPADWDTLANKPASFTPSAHSSTHHTGGTDAIAPNEIGAAWALVASSAFITGDTLLSAGRNRRISLSVVSTANVDLPYENNANGDIVSLVKTATGSGVATIRAAAQMSGGVPLAYQTLGTLSATGQSLSFVSDGTATGWSLRVVDTHTHPATDITSGTLAHERGGLEADVSAYNGLVKISGGSTSAVGIGTGSTEVAAGDHGHGNINSSGLVGTTANLPLKTGTGGIVEAGAFGTGAGEFAEGNHTHTQLHDRSHAITSTSDHTAGNHKVFYSNGSGEIVELALGNSGEVLTSNGATSAPSFAAASGGGVTGAAASASDVLGVSGSDITGVDAGSADRLVFWDDSASKLTYLEAGSGLSISGTTLTSPNMTGATTSAAGAAGAVPAPATGKNTRALFSDGAFAELPLVPAFKNTNAGAFIGLYNKGLTGNAISTMLTKQRRFGLLFVPADGDIDVLAFRTGNAPSTSIDMHIALWECNEDGTVGDLIVDAIGATGTSGSTTVSIAISQTSVTRGFYWMSLCPDGNTSSGAIGGWSNSANYGDFMGGDAPTNTLNNSPNYTATTFDQTTHETFSYSNVIIPFMGFQYV